MKIALSQDKALRLKLDRKLNELMRFPPGTTHSDTGDDWETWNKGYRYAIVDVREYLRRITKPPKANR